MVQNFALAAIVALFATTTFANPTTEATAETAKPVDHAVDASKKEEPNPNKEEEKKK